MIDTLMLIRCHGGTKAPPYDHLLECSINTNLIMKMPGTVMVPGIVRYWKRGLILRR